jgi:methylmalonyl-CoA/ethylmalonyl-CoA epimerase
MTRHIHHINFVVRDLTVAVPVWEKILDQQVTSLDKLDERGVNIARFDLGQSWIVLVQPLRADTVAAKYLEQHGEGFFLMSLGTNSLQAEIERLGEAKFDGPERDGLDDWRVRDVAVAGMFGAQVQFVEDNDS